MKNISSVGFSLLELLFYVAILATLLSVAVPSFYSQLQALHLKLAAVKAHRALVSTRALAYSQGRDLWLHIVETSSEHYQLVVHHDAQLRSPNTLFDAHITHFELSDVLLHTTDTVLRFDGRSGQIKGKGNLTLTKGSQVQIKIIYHDITGRVRICSDDKRALGYAAC